MSADLGDRKIHLCQTLAFLGNHVKEAEFNSADGYLNL